MGCSGTPPKCWQEQNEPLGSKDSGYEDLQKFEKNGAAKHDHANEPVTTRIPARKQQAQHCKCADTFECNNEGRFRCR